MLQPGHKDVPAPRAEPSEHNPQEFEKRMRNGGYAEMEGDCKFVTQILSRIGDKWSVVVVMLLSSGPKRFNELRRIIGSISQRMLTLTLRGLERDGLVIRTVYPTNPPSVDYRLTELGESLGGPVQALGEWANANREPIELARERFDQELNDKD